MKPIKISQPRINGEEIDNVRLVLESGNLAQGQWVKRFENEFSSFCSTQHACAVSSGTAALELALRAAGIGEGDEVIVPAFTFIATANAVRNVGASPVFADIDGEYFTIDPESVNELITDCTKAVIPVHLFGQCAPMEALKDMTEHKGIMLIEDACQAHGARRDGVPAGGLGDMGCFSFYATKNMTTGEGGMVTTDNPVLDGRLRILRNQGMVKRYEYAITGYNARMTDIQAAIGVAQLHELPRLNAVRQSNAHIYDALLGGFGELVTPAVHHLNYHVYHQYVVTFLDCTRRERDVINEAMNSNDVHTAVHYPKALHKEGIYPGDAYCPVAEWASERVLSLPVHPMLSYDDMVCVMQLLEQAIMGEA